MKLAGLIKRVEPMVEKLSGRLPLCPWSSALSCLDPRTLGVHPPQKKIEVIGGDETFKKLRFDGRHEVWFPANNYLSDELWSEYLSVFWTHPANSHYYLSHGTPVKPGDVCIDCGSCEGFFVLQALEADAGKVVCVEPNPYMAQCLERTFADEIKAGRVVIQQVALGTFSATASFSYLAGFPSFGQIGEKTSTSQSVGVETIEHICGELGLSQVDFIKMDIEGAELQAVEGAMPLLKKCHPRMAITTYHRAFDFACLRALLLAAGYKHLQPVGITPFDGTGHRPVMLHAK